MIVMKVVCVKSEEDFYIMQDTSLKAGTEHF